MQGVGIGDLVLDQTRGSRGIIRCICFDDEGARDNTSSSGEKKGVACAKRMGIEWEIPNRGKHNGDADLGFVCTDNRASFAKTDKLHYGQELIHLLEKKYESDIDVESGAGDDVVLHDIAKDVVVIETVVNGREMAFEAHGLDSVKEKQKLPKLKSASLHGAGVKYCGDPSIVSSRLPNLREIDLSLNLFDSWDEIFRILLVLSPHLKIVSLSDNRLGEFPTSVNPACFDHVEEIVLSRIYPMKEKFALLEIGKDGQQRSAQATKAPLHRIAGWRSWGALKSLYLCGYEPNGLDAMVNHLPLSLSFRNLEHVDLSNNGIRKWSDVRSALGNITTLKRLVLNGNPMSRITATRNENSASAESHSAIYGFSYPFSSLQSLSLVGTMINSFSSFDIVDKEMKQILELKIGEDLPLEAREGLMMRREIIARVSGLRLFNGSEISHLERTDSERLYLKFVEQQQQQGKDGVEAMHPRYKQLLQLHGPQYVPASMRELAEKKPMINGTLKLVLVMESPIASTVERRLPLGMTIRQLRLFCCRRYRIPVASLSLHARDPNSTWEFLDNDLSTIGELGLVDGGILRVSAEEKR